MRTFFLCFISLSFWTVTFAQAEDIQAALQQKLETIAQEAGIPGLTFAVQLPDDEQLTFATGLADVEQELKLKPNDRMLLGSVGKTFVSALAMRLVEEKKLNLDNKISRYLKKEKWFEQLPNAKEITVRQLMNHTSGIPEYVYHPDFWKALQENPDRSWKPEELIFYSLNLPARNEAGKGWSYADANYIVLGMIIEQVSKKTVYEQVQDLFLSPLDLKATAPSNKRELEGLVAGYTGREFGEWFGEKMAENGRYAINPQFEWTGGGFITTSSDLARWVKALHTGKVLSQQSTELLHQAVDRKTGEPSDNGYGLGAEIFHTDYGLAYGHSGFMPGYMTLCAYLPEHDISFALQMNADAYNSKLKQGTTVFAIAHQLLPVLFEKLETTTETPITTLILVRHAEKADDGTPDPDLTEVGKQRAERLEALLIEADVTAIYSTAFKRNIQTAAPLSESLDVEIQQYPPHDANFINTVLTQHKGETVLIVGHSNTVPTMLNQLVQEEQFQQLEDSDYSNLFVVTVAAKRAKVTVLQF